MNDHLKRLSVTQERTLLYIRAFEHGRDLTTADLARTSGAGVANFKTYEALVRARYATRLAPTIENSRNYLTSRASRYKLTTRGLRYAAEVIDARGVRP